MAKWSSRGCLAKGEERDQCRCMGPAARERRRIETAGDLQSSRCQASLA